MAWVCQLTRSAPSGNAAVSRQLGERIINCSEIDYDKNTESVVGCFFDGVCFRERGYAWHSRIPGRLDGGDATGRRLPGIVPRDVPAPKRGRPVRRRGTSAAGSGQQLCREDTRKSWRNDCCLIEPKS